MSTVPTGGTEGPPVRVAVGLVCRGGRHLARVRPEGAPLAGYWEFPGGKLEPEESAEDAVRRECLEEAGIEVEVDRLRAVVVQSYPHGRVELSFFDCRTKHEADGPAEGSGFVWVPSAELPSMKFPEANGPILKALADG